jgi:hypothetical protein
MKAPTALITVVAITLGLSAWLGSQSANAGLIRPHTERSSRMLHGDRLRCTAGVSSEVHVGQQVKVRFTLHNRSKRSVKISLGVFSAAFDLKAADGTTYDTGALYEGLPGIPPPIPQKLRGGGTLHLGAQSVNARWPGPLQITPYCLGKALPVLHVKVAATWPHPSESAAVGEVVAAAGHLLDHCRPMTPGVAVDGKIYPPSGTAPPMDARCSVTLSREGRFLDAQVLVLTPPGLAGVQIYQPYETLWPITHILPLASGPPYEAIAWEFVVTREQAIPVAASSIAASNDSDQNAPFFSWTAAGWKQDGEAPCGGTGFAWGGSGPGIEFISVCPA